MTTRQEKYLLGYSRKETARLQMQARLWDPVSHALFDRVGVRRGWKVLEVGPGAGSLHAELRRRVKGPIDAVERSSTYAANLRKSWARDTRGEGQLWECDLVDAALPANHYDLIFTRWVFLFLPRPEQHVAKLVKALKPGGRLAIQDYHRETLAMVPRPAEWERFVAADLAFFSSTGGDASIGGRLPAMYRKAGLDVESIEVTVKSGHPGSDVWNWLSTYFLGVLDRYADHRPFTPEDAVALRRQWLANGRRASSILIGPALLDVVGRKR